MYPKTITQVPYLGFWQHKWKTSILLMSAWFLFISFLVGSYCINWFFYLSMALLAIFLLMVAVYWFRQNDRWVQPFLHLKVGNK